MSTSHSCTIYQSTIKALLKILTYCFFIVVWLISIRLIYNYWIVLYNIFDYKIDEKITFSVIDDYWQITRKVKYGEIVYDFHDWKIISYTWSAVTYSWKIYNAKSDLSEKQLNILRSIHGGWRNSYLTKDKKYFIFVGNRISRKYGFPLLYWENVINVVDLESGKLQQILLYRENGHLYDIADILDVQ